MAVVDSHGLPSVALGSSVAARLQIRSVDLNFNSPQGRSIMHGHLTSIPTASLIDMLFVILAGQVTVTTFDGTEIEQIQRELQRRGEDQNWSFATVH